MTDLATDWPFVESDMGAWREWANANKEQTMSAAHKHNDEIYAAQLIEVLSDVVDILNEAKADGSIFNFQIGQQADGKFALVSLTATKPIVVPQAAAPTNAG